MSGAVLAKDSTTTNVPPINPTDAAGVRAALLPLLNRHPDRVDDPGWVAAAREAWDEFPTSLRRDLRRFRRDSGPTGVLPLGGLPVETPERIKTPTVAGSVQNTSSLPAAILLSVAAGLGDPYAFRPEKSGHLVHDVVPVPGMEEVQGNTGSTRLTFHIENAFHPHRPDFVLLLCLRPDHDGAAGLRTSCVRRVLPLLSASARDTLSRPEFRTAPPPSFGTDVAADPIPHAVLVGDRTDPDLRVDISATEPLTEPARAALDELADVFEETASTTILRTGDLVVVDNRVTVHGRSPFRPRYDGRDRWLQRAFVSTDLRRSRPSRPTDGYVIAD